MATMQLIHGFIYPLALPVADILEDSLETASNSCSLGPHANVHHLLARAASIPSGTLPDIQS